MTLKSTKELCVVTMKFHGKFEKELTCRCKIDRHNLATFDPSTRMYQTFAL